MGGNEGLNNMEVRRSGWKIGDEREEGIIEGKRENKGSREINKRKRKKKKTKRERVEKTREEIYSCMRPAFLKRIDL